jgi:WD40 repeat protein
LKIWDPKKVERLRTLKLEESGVPYELIASPNPKYVALLLHNRIVTFQNGKIFKEINDLDQPLYQISWNPDGSKIAYINKNNELVYYHIQTGLKKVIVNPDKNLQRLIKLNLSGQYGLTQIAGSSFKYDIIELEY